MSSKNVLVCSLYASYSIKDWLALKGYRAGHDFTWEYLDDWTGSRNPNKKVLLFFNDKDIFLLVQLRFDADVKVY